MPSVFSTPKEKMATMLTLLSLWAIFNSFSTNLLLKFILLFVFMFIFEFLFWKIRGIEAFRPTAGAVTTLIIFLVSSPTAPLYLTLLALFIAIGLKQLLRLKSAHIFNPAASGLLVASLFGLPVSWWGIASDTFSLLLTIVLTGYVSLLTIRQWRIVISFLATSFILSVFASGPAAAFGQFLVGNFWFFVLVMLPEPQTAAHYPNTRPIYGTLVALFSFIFPLASLKVDPLLSALLAGNFSVRLIEQKYKK